MSKNVIELIDERNVLGKDFKVYGSWESPLFLAKNVAEWIDYSKTSQGYYNVSKMLMTVDDEEKCTITNSNSGGNKVYLTEDGLYEVLMQSRKPIAKEFKKEVKKILKQMRLTGGAVVNGREEEFIHNYFPSFSEEVKLAMVLDLKGQNENLKKQIEEQRPKVEYHDEVLNSEKLVSITQIANDLGITAQSLNKKLSDAKVQYKDKKGRWTIYKKYLWLIDEKYCDYKITEYGQQLKWTEKGREWIIKNIIR